MIAYVSGVLDEISEKGIVVETGGIGYAIMVPASMLSWLPPVGSQVKIYTHFNVTEDALKLYGFRSADERELFRQLISVSGVGPKAALGILSSMSADELRLAVLSDDEKRIARAPGLGPKTARKVILELKDRFKLTDIATAAFSGNSGEPAPGAREDVIEAMVSLGYSPSQALNAINRIGDITGLDTDELLSLALRQMI